MHDPTHEYDDNCKDCQPVIMDINTGEPLAEDSPIMIALMKAWKERTTLTERRATTKVWMGQSTNSIDFEIMQRVSRILQAAVEGIK